MLIRLSPIRRPMRQTYQPLGELAWRSRCLALGHRGLVSILTALVMIANLVRSVRSLPLAFIRRMIAAVEKPCAFAASMTVGALPYFAHPLSRCRLRPAYARWGCEPVSGPSLRKRGMLENAAATAHAGEGSFERAAIITRPIVCATPTLVVNSRHIRPKLAWGMRNHRKRLVVFARITRNIPAGARPDQNGVRTFWINIKCVYFTHWVLTE
jgi:hypothetical protein